MEKSEEKKITITERWGKKSYKVQYEGGKYLNDRIPHVETSEEGIEGKVFEVGERRTSKMKGKFCVMYEIIGLTNGKRNAHITVYFGPENGDEKEY